MTTVACVWVRGQVPYTADYVVRLQAMVHRWMDRPYRFVCLTDQPKTLPREIHTIPVPSPAPLKGWWAKIHCFNDALMGEPFDHRVLYLDLDSLIVAPLAPILDFPAQFALVPDTGTFQGTRELHVLKRFNSSVMVWNAGRPFEVFARWTPSVAARLWGDQDWIGELFPTESVPASEWTARRMPAEWFPRLSECTTGVPVEAKVVLCKKPKNADAAKRYPWVDAIWRAA